MKVSRYHFEDVDARLPPRKRLLAGLRKQSCENASSSTFSPSSLSQSPSLVPSDLNAHLRGLLGVDSKSVHISPDQIVEASRSAALAAAEVAALARATAAEKAATAAKAVAAAKSALELVFSLTASDTCKENGLRKNKMKKQVPVRLLYKGRPLLQNHGSSEEDAHRLHQDMTSFGRVIRTSSIPSGKIQCHKKPREKRFLGFPNISNEAIACEENLPSICHRISDAGDIGCSVSISEVGDSDKLENNALVCNETDCVDLENIPGVGGEPTYSVNACSHTFEAISSTSSGKRGRFKEKKLPLNLCNVKDQEELKDKPKCRSFPSNEESGLNCIVRTMPSCAVRPPNEAEIPVKVVPVWKCKEFKAHRRFSESKILHAP